MWCRRDVSTLSIIEGLGNHGLTLRDPGDIWGLLLHVVGQQLDSLTPHVSLHNLCKTPVTWVGALTLSHSLSTGYTLVDASGGGDKILGLALGFRVWNACFLQQHAASSCKTLNPKHPFIAFRFHPMFETSKIS